MDKRMPIIGSSMYVNAYGKSAQKPTTAVVSASNNADTCIVRYDLSGKALWSTRISSPLVGNDLVVALATDADGNVYGLGTLPSGMSSVYNSDGTSATIIGNYIATSSFLIKYKPNGVFQWVVPITNLGTLTLGGLTVDSSGNVLFSARGTNVVTIRNVDGTVFSTTTANYGFVVKYNSDGFAQWIGQVSSFASGTMGRVITDASGNVFVTGTTTGDTTIAFNADNTAGPTLSTRIGTSDGFVVKYSPTGTALWIARFSGGASSTSLAGFVATDSDLNCYVASSAGVGVTTTVYDSSDVAFPSTLSTLGDRDLFLAKYSPTGSVLWIALLGNLRVNVASGLEVDSANNVYLVGYSTGTGATFTCYNADTTAFSPALTSIGTGDVFLVKYNPLGAVQWNVKTGTTSADTATSIAIDASDNVYVGTTAGDVYNADQSLFGSSTTSALRSIIKYNSSGIAQWIRSSFGKSSDSNIRAIAIRGDALYMTVGFESVGSIMNGQALALFTTLPNAGLVDSFVIKYNRNGAPQWTARIASTADDTSWFTSTDSLGNMYATGSTGSGTTTYFYNADGTTFGSSITSTGTDVFLVKYSASGVVQWVTSLATTGDDTGFSAATDSSGNVYVTGTYADATLTAYNSDGSPFATTLSALGGGDCFIAKYDSSGFVQWLTRIGSTNQDVGYGIATDTLSNVYVCGTCTGSLGGSTEFYNADGTLFGTLAPIGTTTPDAFVTKYDSSGTCQWMARLGGSSTTELGRGIATDSNNNVYVCGNGTGAVSGYNAGGGAVFASVSNSGGDCFIAKYDTNGTGQWMAKVGNSGADTGPSISTDRAGNVYVLCNTSTSGAGANTAALNADGTTYPNQVFPDTSPGGDTRIVKYNTSGFVQWIAAISSGSISDVSYGIKADPRGNIYVVGQFGPNATRVTVTNADRGPFATFSESCAVVKYDTNGMAQWAQILRGNTTGVIPRSVSVDPFDGVYVTGTSQSGEPLLVYTSDYKPYKVFSTDRGATQVYVAKYSKTAVPQWLSTIGSISSTVAIQGVGADSSGNIYIAPNLKNDTITILNATGTTTTVTRTGATTRDTTTLIKYTPSGIVEWTALLTTTSLVRDLVTNAVYTSSSGDVYVAGIVASAAATSGVEARTPADSVGLTIPISSSTHTGFIVKYNSSGIPQWGARLSSTVTVPPGAVAADSSGNVYMVGTYGAVVTAINSNGSSFATTLPIGTATDIYLVKYNSSGFVQWITSIVSSGTTDVGYGVSVDSSGNIYIATQTSGSTTQTVFARNPDGTFLTGPVHSGGTDGMLIKYNSAGFAQWIARVASVGADSLRSVAATPSGDVYVTGTFTGTVTISNAGDGSSVFGTLVGAGGTDTMVVKYNSSGTAQWAARLVSVTASDIGYGLTTDSAGSVYVVGQAGSAQVLAVYNADNTLFGSMYVGSLSSIGTNSFLVKYNSLGAVQWISGIGGGDNDESRAVASDASDNIVMTGTFVSRTTDFESF
jgi:hypothetical protein